MAAITIYSDLGAPKIKSATVSTVSPSICHEVMGLDVMILVFWMLSFKPIFSLSSFTFIKGLFSSSLLSAIRVVSSAYLRLLIFLSRVQLFVIPWTVAQQVPLSTGFSRQEYWSGLPLPSPGHLPNPGIEPGSPALHTDSLLSEPQGKPLNIGRTDQWGHCNVLCGKIFNYRLISLSLNFLVYVGVQLITSVVFPSGVQLWFSYT